MVTSTLEEAVAVAEFVQESAPEDLGPGQELLVKIDSATRRSRDLLVHLGFPDDAVRYSGPAAGRASVQPAAPDPAGVEVVGGEHSERWAVDFAAEFFEEAPGDGDPGAADD